jgi:AcrR family transcriptional regulator
MDVFWARGYEGATLQELQAAMGGIAPPSFYAAFGSKEDLFMEAVDLYRQVVGGRSIDALEGPKTARASIEAMLRETVRSFSTAGAPRGCLLVTGAFTCASQKIQDHLLAMRRQAPEVIERRLERGVADGDLPAGLDLAGIAAFYTTILHGLALAARDERSRKTLMAVVESAMTAWEPLTATRRAGAPAPARRRPSARRQARKRSRTA